MKASRILKKLKFYLTGRSDEPQTVQNVQELRAAFTRRYHNFKLLLTANNKALEIMSDLEKALDGSQTFGMSFVRSNCTAVLVNVFRIVKHLEELAPGKYSALFDRFKSIQETINLLLVHKKLAVHSDLVLPLKAVDRNLTDQVGSKMANVAEIKNEIGVPVPPGFVITASAYDFFVAHNDLQAEIDRRIQAADTEEFENLYSLSADIQQLIIRSSVPKELEDRIYKAFEQVEEEAGPGVKVSLRSSALGEDTAGTSFAGQFRSVLNVSKENLLDAYKEVIASKYGLPAVTYRLNRGIPDEDVAMCVGCMVMVNAASGGVMYSTNPINIRDKSIFINSVWGLPKAVVDGTVDPDVFVLSRDKTPLVKSKEIKTKEVEFLCYPDEGVCRTVLIPEKRTTQSISDVNAIELAKIAIKLENYYGSPQDIEWAITENDEILILQCRPLQQYSLETDKKASVIEGEKVITTGGITASPGVAVGKVYIVRSDVDKLKFPQGAVLVTAQSLPRWAPLLSNASAVVTELGGVAGHLANVAREFGVPALFGVHDVTNLLKNDQLITVDAEGLTIYDGEVKSLLELVTQKKNLMEGSPIFETLQRAAEHIVPLNLLDPDSPEFHPKKCRTLHDITRFCHEKAVHEMFNFGKEHHFSERSSKQLMCHVPMQWWIINLDDGYKHDVEGKFVHIDNIVSIPMLSIWEGVIAVPWEGPPPLEAGGFMSVLIQATSNPALDPSMKSAYAARNYFMISKNFCSLNSRFGFHFSTVEALISERPIENYISFAFKGGAADYPRRVRRASFVGNILEEFGFRTEMKKDSVFARIEGRDQDFMKERLRIIGYMIIHTRQLDMVMANDSSVHKYRTKIMNEVQTMLSNPPSAYQCPTSPEA